MSTGLSRLQQCLKEEQDEAASLTKELVALRRQLSADAPGTSQAVDGSSPVERVKPEEQARHRLRLQVEAASYHAAEAADRAAELVEQLEEALRNAAEQRGFASASAVLLKEQEDRQKRFQKELQVLQGARHTLRQDAARFQDNADEARTVELHVEQLAMEKNAQLKKLQLRLRASAKDIHGDSASLSQSLTGQAKDAERLQLSGCYRGSKRPRPDRDVPPVSKSVEPADIPTMEIL